MNTVTRGRVTAHHLRAILKFRRAREFALGRDLFADPAWDLLLQLYRAHLEDNPVKLSELPHRLGLPKSVVARWAAALADHGLIECSRESHDCGEVRARLSARGSVLMRQLFDDWSEAFGSV